jgi:toxin ParE1/3/4
MRIVRWEVEARHQYRDCLTYISIQNRLAAERLDDEIRDKVDMLPHFPEMGRKGRVAGSRELIVHPNYILVYVVRELTIDVIRFLHVRKQYP